MKFFLLAAMSLSISYSASGTEYATTENGRRVQLNANGTWKYAQDSGGDGYRTIQFSDFMVDGAQLVGQKVRIKGVGGFNNPRGEARPDGALYQQMLTIGPSISVTSADLDRTGLAAVHRCPLSCSLEVLGTVDKTQRNTPFVRAAAIRVLKEGP